MAAWPTASTSRFFSSSGTSTSVSSLRAISNRTRLGCTRSPGSTLRVSTVPATSVRIVVLASCALALATRARAAASFGLPATSERAVSRACSAAVRAMVSACIARSIVSRATACR